MLTVPSSNLKVLVWTCQSSPIIVRCQYGFVKSRLWKSKSKLGTRLLLNFCPKVDYSALSQVNPTSTRLDPFPQALVVNFGLKMPWKALIRTILFIWQPLICGVHLSCCFQAVAIRLSLWSLKKCLDTEKSFSSRAKSQKRSPKCLEVDTGSNLRYGSIYIH